MNLIGNITLTETQNQGFLVVPSQLKPRKLKPPQDCYLSFIPEIQGGDYGGAILVRKEPRNNRDIYFKFRPRKAKPTEMRSYRRNYSHISVASYRTKKDGSTRKNISYMNCNFVELDGTNDGTIKSLEDVYTLINKNNLPEASYVIQTSIGHYHILWDYVRPLPWTTKGESYWFSQQKKLIELFQKDGFNVDVGASMNPTQNLRNPSQLHPYNFKRKCEVVIHTSYKKTSLRAIYRALNKTNIANPRPIPASVRFGRLLRENETFITTHAELAETLGTSLSTAERVVKRAIANGDLFAVGKVGNNKAITRTTRYRSGLYLEPQFSEPSLSIFKDNSLRQEVLLADFQANGAEEGHRNRTIFMLGLHIKHRLGKEACVESIRDALEGGAVRCHVPVREFERTLENVMKPEYDRPLSIAKLREWGLLEPEHSRKSFLH